MIAIKFSNESEISRSKNLKLKFHKANTQQVIELKMEHFLHYVDSLKTSEQVHKQVLALKNE